MLSTPAVRAWSGAEADKILHQHADRIIGSRFVIAGKEDDEGSRVKARWRLQGHLDPDFKAKILSGPVILPPCLRFHAHYSVSAGACAWEISAERS